MIMHGTKHNQNIRKKENDYKQNDILYSIMFNYVDDGERLACLSHNVIDLYRFQ